MKMTGAQAPVIFIYGIDGKSRLSTNGDGFAADQGQLRFQRF
jgi:hypothetical protein